VSAKSADVAMHHRHIAWSGIHSKHLGTFIVVQTTFRSTNCEIHLLWNSI